MNQALVNLYCNPWREKISDNTLLQIMQYAADQAKASLALMINQSEVDVMLNSFAAVILMPNSPGSPESFQGRVMAIVEIGPHGSSFVQAAAEVARIHDINGTSCGNSTEQHGMVGGGCGLGDEKDRELLREVLANVATLTSEQGVGIVQYPAWRPSTAQAKVAETLRNLRPLATSENIVA